MNNRIFKIYFSCPSYPIIMDDVTEENIKLCTDAAIEISAYLIDWEKMDGFPKMRLYTSLFNNEFIQEAYNLSRISKEDIVQTNLNLLQKSDMVLLYTDCYYHPVAQTEMQCARDNRLPLFIMPNISEMTISSLKLTIKLVLQAKG